MMKIRHVLLLLALVLPVTSIAQTNQEQATDAVVMIEAVRSDGKKGYGAGVIVGKNDMSVYIVTAAHVTYEGEAKEINVRFRSAIDKQYKAEIVPLSLERGEGSTDFVTVKVPLFSSFKLPEIVTITPHEVPEKVRFIGRRNPTNYWSNTPLFNVIDIKDDDYDPNTFIGADSLMSLRGYSGGGVFDTDWRLTGVHLADSVANDVTGDVTAKFLSLTWIRNKLNAIQVPLAPYMKDVLEGTMPEQYMGKFTPNIIPFVRNHDLGGEVMVTAASMFRALKNLNLDVYVEASDGWVRIGGYKRDVINGNPVNDNFIVSADTRALNICASHQLPNGANGYTYIMFSNVVFPVKGITGISPAFGESDDIVVQDWLITTRGDPCGRVLQKLSSGELDLPDKAKRTPVVENKLNKIKDDLLIPKGIVIGKKTRNAWGKDKDDGPTFVHFSFGSLKELKINGNEKFKVYISMKTEDDILNVKADENFLSKNNGLSIKLDTDITQVESIKSCFVNNLNDGSAVGISQNFEKGEVDISMHLISSKMMPRRSSTTSGFDEFVPVIGGNGVSFKIGSNDSEVCKTDLKKYTILKNTQDEKFSNRSRYDKLNDDLSNNMMKIMREKMGGMVQ